MATLGVAADSSITPGEVDVLVIGAGQAGLAMGCHLAERGLSFVVADANPEVGHVWRSRWESLRLFTAGQYNDLPGMSFPAARDSYPGKDEVAEFLRSYVAKFDLPVRLNTTVTRLTRDDEGYLAETTSGPIRANQVVVATGHFRFRSHRPFSSSLTPNCRSSTAPLTAGPRTSRRAGYSSLAARTPVSRSRWSYRSLDRLRSRSGRSCRRCPRGRSDATSGGG